MIGVVVNPHAGRNRGQQGRVQRLQDIVGDAGIVFGPSTLDELEDLARELKTRGISILAVCGGDGSFFRTLSSVVRVFGAEHLPKFLPLRAGSMNTIARAVGCRRGSPETVLASIMADLRAQRPLVSTERQLLCINATHYGFMTGAGAVVRFLQAYYASGSGPITAARVFGRALGSALVGSEFASDLLAPFSARIDCGSAPLAQQRFNFLYASSINEIGLGIQVTYRGDERPGYFHLIAADIRPAQALVRLPRLCRGRPLALPTVYDDITTTLHIEFPQPTHYMVDGDVLEAVSRLDVVAGPRLTILC